MLLPLLIIVTLFAFIIITPILIPILFYPNAYPNTYTNVYPNIMPTIISMLTPIGITMFIPMFTTNLNLAPTLLLVHLGQHIPHPLHQNLSQHVYQCSTIHLHNT